jgi:V/A-type H+-transporting ATPase subunit G/H
MEDTLKRLLSVETKAEQLVTKAKTEREKIIQQALHEAYQTEQEFAAQIPQLHDTFIKKAENRATQTIAELHKRYEERKLNLHNLAEENQQKALEASVHLLMQVGKSA